MKSAKWKLLLFLKRQNLHLTQSFAVDKCPFICLKSSNWKTAENPIWGQQKHSTHIPSMRCEEGPRWTGNKALTKNQMFNINSAAGCRMWAWACVCDEGEKSNNPTEKQKDSALDSQPNKINFQTHLNTFAPQMVADNVCVVVLCQQAFTK